jgi:Fic family protein
MGTSETAIRALDMAYNPFPTFAAWTEKCSVDLTRWNRYLTPITAASASSNPALFEKAREVASRAAAIETGAIEGLYEVDRGFTYTVAIATATWEATFMEKDKRVRSLIESQMHAYEYVLTLATSAEPLSEAAIRLLHEEICRSQETYLATTSQGPQEQELSKGKYKALPNHVRTRDGKDHSYAPVDQTPPEMQRLMREIRSEAFAAAHTVIQAAYAHYAFVAIHPFADGNGRVARALASVFTYRSNSIPLMIFSDRKVTYFDSLAQADDGNYQSFVDFVLSSCLDTMALVDESIKTAAVQSTRPQWELVQSFYLTRGGYTDEQVTQSGEQFTSLMKEAFEQAATDNFANSKPTITYKVRVDHTNPGKTEHRTLAGMRRIGITCATAPPVTAAAARSFDLLLPVDAGRDDDIQILGTGNKSRFAVRMDEITPVPTVSFRIRARMFAERVISEMEIELANAALQIGGALRGRKVH